MSSAFKVEKNVYSLTGWQVATGSCWLSINESLLVVGVTIHFQSKSCTFWNVLVAVVRHNFYSEGKHSLFLVCIALFKLPLRLGR